MGVSVANGLPSARIESSRAVLATGLGALAATGGVVFIISDMSIAITSFVYPDRLEHGELLIMSTYLVAQLLIVLGVIETPELDESPAWSTRTSAGAVTSSSAEQSVPRSATSRRDQPT